jgi:dihydrofolate reductase
MKLTVVNHLTLDGVMQSPAAPDEDTRGGFAHGGWAVPYQDEVMGRFMGERMSSGEGGALLLGRRTYEHFYNYWPHQTDNPFTEVLNRSRKYVASRTLAEPLPWENSTLLSGDVPAAVRELGGDAVILGSGQLIHSLLREGLIDTFVLTISPLVLGSGLRMFGDESALAKLRLVDTVTTTTGVIIATYER